MDVKALPSAEDDISLIWNYVRSLDIPKNGGFTDWMEWMGWNGVQYKNFKDKGLLPESKKDLQICLAACLERDIVSRDFRNGDERQHFPRALLAKISEVT